MSKTGTRVLANLLHKDLLTVYRDRFLVFLTMYPLVITAATRYVVSRVSTPHVDVYLAPGMILMAQFVVGTVVGFGLIEEREMQTWAALKVMPGGSRFAGIYYLGFTALVSTVVGLFAAVIYWVAPRNIVMMLAGTLVGSLTGSVVAFVLGSLATNKIEGMALTKTTGLALMTPILLFVAPPVWQAVVAWSPWYWSYIMLLWAYGGSEVAGFPLLKWPGHPPLLAAVVAAALGAAATAFFWRAYSRRAR